MVVGYEVQEDGTLTEVEISKEYLSSTLVICIVDDETKSIYLWKGSQAGVRVKFIGARVATNLRTEYGFNFKVRSIDEGEEPPTFFTALDGTTSATRVLKPGESTPPPAPPKAKTEYVSEPKTTPPPTPKPETESYTTSEPKTTPPPRPPTPQPSPNPTIPARPASTFAPAPVGEVADMIREMEMINPPEGYQRELVIVYNDLYTVAEHRTAVFGQEKIERRIEKVKDPPEGTFMAEGFIPRVIVKDGRVLGIELLKGTPDAILSPIKAEMKERLSDLITFFKSETEDSGDTKAKPKDKKGKRLVAK
ncbi:MAG: hypothetical protein E4H14_01085 [Candidatus Thorarchaeota archaeon]|nr:MAG: hypothetical protein E4H14_01085 [Candidatus Thorarchaeota archaeon]